jgi:hypothetical protein
LVLPGELILGIFLGHPNGSVTGDLDASILETNKLSSFPLTRGCTGIGLPSGDYNN